MKFFKTIAFSSFFLVFLFFILNHWYPLDKNRIVKAQSSIIYDRDKNIVNIKLSQDGFLRMPLGQISKEIKETLLAYEDKYFYYHFGINPFSIFRALWFNLQHKRVIGASTITMQLARIMHHKPRSISNKLIEMFMALQLEWKYSKEEILRLYLNNAPYGGNIEGFASASWQYFGLKSEALSLAQIAYLVSIPKNPNANRPKYIQKVERLKNRVLNTWIKSQNTQYYRYTSAINEKIYPYKRDLPHQIPHLARKITHTQSTSIDSALQNKIENLVKEKIAKFQKLDIHNASVIVIENKTMQILAYVASQDFKDNNYSGQVDGIRNIISPASTLKPFIYAKALEKGLITPLKKLYDVPLSIGEYSPLNYTKRFVGEVSVSDALQNSLNIPAVSLDRLLAKNSLYSILKKAKISSINQAKSYYASALVLGGCGLSLLNITELFASLANGGIYQKSSYLLGKNSSEKIQILSKESAYLVSEILVNAPRKHLNSSWEYIDGMQKVAFKTGTSAHFKDLLSIGYSPKYTVGVWYGNFNNKKRKKTKDTSGLQIASPTLLEVFGFLPSTKWFAKPKTLIKKRICQDAIKIGKCHSLIEDWTIKGVKLQAPCQTLRPQVLNRMLKRGLIESFSSLKENDCYEEWRQYKPYITTPLNRQKYIQNKNLAKAYKKIPIQCYAYEENTTIYYLIDDNEPLLKQSGEKSYVYFEEGKHHISCLDRGAKIREISFEVEEI